METHRHRAAPSALFVLLLALPGITGAATDTAGTLPVEAPALATTATALSPALPAPVDPSAAPAAPLPPGGTALGWHDAGHVAAAGAFMAFAQYRYHAMPATDPARLRRSDLNAFDRWAAGNYNPAADVASDVVILSLLAAPMALSAWDAHAGDRGWSPFLTDAVILAEALALSSAVNLTVRSLRIHPRPFLYGSDAPAEDMKKGEASGSYYSGHASAAFLAATYLSITYPRRHPEFKGEAWLWAGSLGAAATVAGLRVAAGKHFPSDVVTGAAAGMLFGWLVPRLHFGIGGHGEAKARAEVALLPVDEGIHPALVVRF